MGVVTGVPVIKPGAYVQPLTPGDSYRSYDSTPTHYAEMLHNGTDAIVQTDSGHIQIIPGTSKFVKISILRQDDTANTYKTNGVTLTGWGIFAQGAAANKSETVTFGITFAQRPIVLATYGGDSAAANTGYGQGANTVKGPVCMKAHTIATGSFIAQIHTSDGTSWGATDNTFYQWLAIGEL